MEITVEITNFCKEECDFCSSSANRYGKHLDYKKVKDFILKNVSWEELIWKIFRNLDKDALDIAKTTFERINISGGEPLSHPQFYKILILCERFSNEIWVYSNAIRNLAYNSSVLREINVKANVCMIPGRNVYVPQGNFSVNLLRFVPQGRGIVMKTVEMSCSSIGHKNCSECNHVVLRADGKVSPSPCRKEEYVK